MSGQPSDVARSIVRTQVLEEVTEMGGSPRTQEARLLQVEAAANTTAAMTYEQLVIFHHQKQALTHEVALRQQQQEEMASRSEQQQAILGAQQAALLTKLAEQERTAKEHKKALQYVSHAFGAQSRAMAEVREKVNTQARRQSGRWGLFAEGQSQRLAVIEATAGVAAQTAQVASAAAPLAPATTMNLAGFQQVPMAPVYKGSTRRERCVFMDSYLRYVWRLTVLNQGTGRDLLLMLLAACVDPAIVARICEYNLGKSFEDVSEDDWRSYFQKACGTHRQVLHAFQDNVHINAQSAKLADAESRVGRLLADFHAKLEEIDMTDLPVVKPKSCVKILMAAIRPMGLKSLIEKELKREDHVRLMKNEVDFTHWLRRHMEAYLPYERLVGRSEALTEMKDEKPKKEWKAKRNGFWGQGGGG